MSEINKKYKLLIFYYFINLIFLKFPFYLISGLCEKSFPHNHLITSTFPFLIEISNTFESYGNLLTNNHFILSKFPFQL